MLEDLDSRCLLSGISVFPASTTAVYPTGITKGSDGNIWFSESSDQIGMVNPTTHVVTEIPLPQSVGFAFPDLVSLTAGPDGNIWFADFAGDTIGMINPKTDAVSVFSIPTPQAEPDAITAGPDGNIWFTERGANQIGMINPKTDAITEFPVPTANAWLDDITAGPDGNLWFTEQVGGKIGMINPTTDVITEYPVANPESLLSGITAGPDGNLWFTDYNAIGQINPTTDTITEFPIPAGPAGTIFANGTIAAGPDGNLWFSYFNSDEVGKINPTTDAITQYPIPLDEPGLAGVGGAAAITAGPDGNMWITLNNADEIGVFDPQTLSNLQTEPPPPITPISPQPPIISSPPTAPTTPATPGMSFGFTVTLKESSGYADTASSGAVTLALVDNPGGATLTVTTRNGVDTFSGLTLKKRDDRPGYKLVSHSGNPNAIPKGPTDVASTRPIRIANEEILTAGRGKDKHVVGFEIVLSKKLDPTAARSVANRTVRRTTRQAGQIVAQPVKLQVDYNAPAGAASLILAGKAKIVRGGNIVVVARSK